MKSKSIKILQNIKIENFLFLFILLSGISAAIFNEWATFRANGALSFPLDDTWIHLQFAKNLHEFGKFSFFKNELVTAGSTSPLYVGLLYIGMFITSHMMILTYVLGIAFLALSAVVFFRICNIDLDKKFFAFVGMWLLFFEPKLHWAELCGMETTFFIFLTLSAYYYYQTSQPGKFGFFCALMIWARPDAIIFYGCIAANEVLKKFQRKKTNLHMIRIPMALVIISTLSYFAFNYNLSGTFLPNTYAAKLKYYEGTRQGFGAELFQFFTEGPMCFFIAFVLIGIGFVFSDVYRKKTTLLVPTLWCLLMLAIYWIKLPYLYQRGRYFMPMLPFIIILGLYGIRRLCEWPNVKNVIQKHTFDYAKTIAIVFCLLFPVGCIKMVQAYIVDCAAMYDTRVGTATWIRDHLPKDAVIAAHDVGALAYYSDRKVVDLVGLISPEIINDMNDMEKMEAFMTSQHVTHIVVLNTWFDVVNENPIYQTNLEYNDFISVFPFRAGHTHIAPKNVKWLTDEGNKQLALNQPEKAIEFFQTANYYYPISSKIHAQLGISYIRLGNLDDAEKEFHIALKLHSKCWLAKTGLAEISLRRGKVDKAIWELKAVVTENPNYALGFFNLSQIYTKIIRDDVLGQYYLHRYELLVNSGITE